jgi:Condensation domain
VSAARGPLTFGQTSMWRSIRDLPRSRWHEVNLGRLQPIAVPCQVAAAQQALAALERRHPSLRTTYDLDARQAPEQCVHPPGAAPVEVVEGSADDARRLVAKLRARPLHLHREYGWLSYVVTQDGMATHIALVHHHMLSDGMGMRVFWDDFDRQLRLGGEPGRPEGDYDLVELAVDQRRSDVRQARQQAAARYWDATLTAASQTAPTGLGIATTPVLEGRLRSHRSRAAGARLAAHTRTSETTVLLAAFARAIADVQRVRSVPLWLLSSNRYDRRWERCVTVLGQWTPLLINVGDDDFAAFAARLHTSSLLAYRHGMYDPELIASVRARHPPAVAETENVWAVNHYTEAETEEPGGTDHDCRDGEFTWEPVFQNVGPRFYLKVGDNPDGSWDIRLRTRGIDKAQTEALVRHVHVGLIDEASKLDGDR